MNKAYELTPWTKVAVPHEDILGGDFDLSSYAANLGQVDTDALGCPAVYRDPVAFFRATYMTEALRELLQDVCRVLTGGAGNRVLQLRTPFGGGKTHTLIALLHLMRSRGVLNKTAMFDGWPDPGDVRVVVLPCLDLDAAGGREVDGVQLHTLWGELAWRLGGRESYEIVRQADERRVNPGGDNLRKLIGDKPTLILLDEVLTYVEAALGVAVGADDAADTNLGRQTMMFLQFMTEVSRGLPNAAMVYSLQRSVREAVGDENLLEMLDNLVSRIDAKKEPVRGDEVLRVVQRRLFSDIGPESVHEQVGDAYGELLTDFLSQHADTEAAQREARDRGAELARRVQQSYPFHPELLDLMYHRWGTLPSYQRTRGALQFLACIIGAVWKHADSAGSLIGPGDVPLSDGMVRNTFFSQVGEREQMKAVLDADLLGATGRCKRIDQAMAARAPAYQSYRIGTRLTRAVALYSFGSQPGEEKGVLKGDLLAATQVPGLPGDVLEVALVALNDTLLYVHSTGRRYRFLKEPNLNKLIDDEVRKIEAAETRDEVKRSFAEQLDARDGFCVWPEDSAQAPDRVPRFTVLFLGPEHALSAREKVEALALDWTEHCGNGKRRYRNALAFAVPNAAAMDKARAAARKSLAIGNLITDRKRHGFTNEQVADLVNRKSHAATELAANVRQLYTTLLLPMASPPEEANPIRLQRFEVYSYQAAGGQLMATIYKTLENHVFAKVLPRKLISCAHLGTKGEAPSKSHWIPGPELVDQFFGSPQYPKLLTLAALRGSVAEGVKRGAFGYVMGASVEGEALELHGKESLTFHERDVEGGDIDLSGGSYLVSGAYARLLKEGFKQPEPDPDPEPEPDPNPDPKPDPDPNPDPRPDLDPDPKPDDKALWLKFRATQGQLFQAFQALTVLGDMADAEFVANVQIYARSKAGFDKNTYETAVVMSLEEEGVEVLRK